MEIITIKTNISMKKFLFLSLLTSLMVLVGCKKDVESVTVTPESATLVVGNTLQLKVLQGVHP